MGTTGVIFAAIAIAWAAYLVPNFVRKRGDETPEETQAADHFAESARIIRSGTAPLLNQDMEKIASYEISTPQTRRAAIRELRRLERLAAVRRRRVLLGLMAVISAVVGVSGVQLVPEWSVAIPAGVLVGFFVVSRVSVRRLHKHLDTRYRTICEGNNEKTIFLSRKEVAAAVVAAGQSAATPDGPKKPGVLWDPVPITMPTYVSKPLAPRTVRTIDLSGPSVAVAPRPEPPVTADARPLAGEDEPTRAHWRVVSEPGRSIAGPVPPSADGPLDDETPQAASA